MAIRLIFIVCQVVCLGNDRHFYNVYMQLLATSLMCSNQEDEPVCSDPHPSPSLEMLVSNMAVGNSVTCL